MSKEVCGPSVLCLGNFVSATEDGHTVKASGGMFHRFGMDDHCSGDLLLQLARHRTMPDLTVAYFADYDYRSHEVGPQAALPVIEEIDACLGDVLESWGGIDAFLQQFCVIVTGDHSQSDIDADPSKAAVKLHDVLAEFSLADPVKGWSEDGYGDRQLMICPNMRAAEIYFRNPANAHRERVLGALMKEARVDQVFWRADLFGAGARGYHVATADRGTLHFWRGRSGRGATDPYGNAWSWNGDLAAVDASVARDGRLRFGDYPNAFERLAGALDHRDSGHLWVTARPGHEFQVPGTNVRTGGGSHGSLHGGDSLVPLLVAGMPDEVRIPDEPRIIDLTTLCLDVLGIVAAPDDSPGSTLSPDYSRTGQAPSP